MSHYDLELVKLRKVYPNGTVAVEGFDLQVDKGEFVSFVGPSGCGKTTTLRMIAGLETITSGDILVRDRNISALPPEKRPVSTIFQNYALFPHMTVRQNIAFGLEVRGLPSSDVRFRCDEIMAKLELTDVADQKGDNLSGGQKQRVALARGLVVEPDILLLDEPLGSLDANLRKSIQVELKLLQRNLGMTFIFVTHAQSEALSLSDRIVVMNAGRVEQISSPVELYTRPKTPFVARFVGKNLIFDGTFRGADGDLAALDTPLGTFRGTRVGHPAAGAAAIISVPTEAIEVYPAGGADRSRFGDNVVSGVLTSEMDVARSRFLDIRLPSGGEIRIESHVQKYADRSLALSAPVDVAWPSAEASVIPA